MSNDKYITLEQLTRTTKGLVNKVNAESIVFDSKIGNLNNLTTTAKTDLVSAINEAAASGGSSGSGTSDYTALTNKPSINNVTLTGNLTTSDLGITIPTVTDTYSSSSTDAMSGVAVNSAITTAIGNINSFDVSVVQALPTQDIDTHTIYFVPKTGSVTDVHDEYMYINNNWELLGSTAVDLSGYLQSSDIAAWAKAANKPTYTANEVGALPSTTSYVSSFNGTSGDVTFSIPSTSYTSNARLVLEKSATELAATSYLSTKYSVGVQTLNIGYDGTANGRPGSIILGNELNSQSGYPQGKTDLVTSATSNTTITLPASTGTLALTSDIPTVPTTISSFTNDVGYLTLADLPIYDGTVQNG